MDYNYKISNIVGHEKEIRFLDVIFKNDRIPSGMIFYGQKNIGKRFIATSFAASVLCRDYLNFARVSDSADIRDYFCGKCPSCIGVLNSTNPNLMMIEPLGNLIKLEKINQINSILSLKPSFDSHRFIIIDEAASMNRSAMNALLKILEEPPSKVCFILIASNISGLLPTIVSRCSLLGFTGIRENVLFNTFKSKYKTKYPASGGEEMPDDDALAVYSKIANGSYSSFERLLSGKYFEARSLIIDNIFKASSLWNNKNSGYYDLSDTFGAALRNSKGKPSAKIKGGSGGKPEESDEKNEFFEILLIILRDIFIYYMTNEGKLLYNSDICDDFGRFINNSGITADRLLNMIDLTINYLDKTDYNLNKTIAMDAYFSSLVSFVRR